MKLSLKQIPKTGKTILKFAALAAYSFVVLILVFNHEYWFDEAQAWNIARDNDIAGIFKMMRYEGHPPLWHFILKIFISLGCSWRALGLISWGASTLTAAVILFALPAKPYLKAAMLLSGGMLYVNSVISRIYCVINLLVVLLAWIYPHRKKHPLLFGLIVALLADTHICMCGLVGIIGIFMLIDYFKDFGTNTAKQNVLNTLGLLIAGAGVVVLILPLMYSLGSNSYAAELTFTIGSVFKKLIMSPSELIGSACSSNLPSVLGMFLSVPVQFALVAALIFLRKKRRALTVTLVFAAFYLVIAGVIWYAQPNRGAVFLFTLAAVFVMDREAAKTSKERKAVSGSATPQMFVRMDAAAENTLSVLFAVILMLTVPSGIKFAVDDLSGEFAPHKAAAEFIGGNISEDALLVTLDDSFVEIMTYLPGRKIYSMKYGRFYTYCSHEIAPDEFDADKFIEIAEWYDEIYYISYPFYSAAELELVYRNDNCIPFLFSEDSIAVYKGGTGNIIEFIG